MYHHVEKFMYKVNVSERDPLPWKNLQEQCGGADAQRRQPCSTRSLVMHLRDGAFQKLIEC